MAISPPVIWSGCCQSCRPHGGSGGPEKLKANRAAFAATSLAENGKGFSNTVDVLDHIGQKSGLANIQNRTKTEEVPESYRKFEAMVLQNFVKSMLPSEGEDVYGKGATGDIWKGMMAEQLGNVMAKGDGIGIAKQMYSEQLRRQEGKIVNASTDDDDRNTALSMIDDFQRKTFGTPTAEAKTDRTG